MFNRGNAHQGQKQDKALTEHGKGIVKGNPRRCLFCMKAIRPGDRWITSTSAPDPQYGSYTVIVHDKCNGKR